MINKKNNFSEYKISGCIVRIKDDSIKTQDMEIIQNEKVIGIVKEIVSRTFGCIKVCYELNGDLFDNLEGAIDTLLFNINK